MSDPNVLTVLSNLYAQLGPLITRVNSLHAELQHIKESVSHEIPRTLTGHKRPLDHFRSSFMKKRRLSSDAALLLLPDEILIRILKFLDLRSLLMFSMTCKEANFAANEEMLWFPFVCQYFSKLDCITFPARYGENHISVFNRRASALKNWKSRRYQKASMKTSLMVQACMNPSKFDRVYLASKGGSNVKSVISEINIVNGATESEIRTPATCYDLCVDSERLFVSGPDIVRVYDRNSGELSYTINNIMAHAYRMRVTSDHLVTAIWDGNIKVFNPKDGSLLHSINAHRNPIHSLAFSSGIIATGSSDHTIKLWNLSGQLLSTHSDHTLTVTDLHVIKGASKMMSCSKDKLLKYWDINTSECIRTFTNPDEVTTLAFRGDNICLSGDKLGNVLIWDVRQPTHIGDLRGHTKGITALSVSEMKSVSCDEGGTLFIWDFAQLYEPMALN